jgi:hypothetical protein
VSNRYGYDGEDRHITRYSIAKLRIKLNRERPARQFAAKATAPKVEKPKAAKPKARSAHPSRRQFEERIAIPATAVKKAIVREVLSDPEASLAEIREKLDDLGYQVSDTLIGCIKQETHFFLRVAHQLGIIR